MDLRSTQLKDTYGNLLTIGTSAGSPTTGTIENGDGQDITILTVAGKLVSTALQPSFDTNFYNVDGTISSYSASNYMYVNGLGGASGQGLRLNSNGSAINFIALENSNDSITLNTNSNERLRIDSSGTIKGIGTYSAGSSIKIFEAERSGGAVASDWSYDDASTDMSLGTSTAHSFSLKTSDTNRLTIDSSGNVGINETNPDYPLHIKAGTNILKLETTSDGRTQLGGYDSSDNTIFLVGSPDSTNAEFWNYKNGYLRFATNSTERLRIDSSGIVQARRTRSNTVGDVALSLQPTDSTIHYGFRIDSANNFLNIDRVDSPLNLISITGAGNVGIGTASAEKRLHINDNTQANQAIRFGNPNATPYGEINYDSSGSEHLYIRAKGTISGYGNIVFESGGSLNEAMRIDSSGAVGINNSSPNSFATSVSTSSSLVIGQGASGVSPGLTLWQGNSAQATINFASANTGAGQYEGRIRYTRDTGVMDFRTNGLDNVLVLNASGNVGIGTSPNSKLEVAGTIDVNTASSGLPTIKLSHTNAGADNFEIKAGTTGVANSGFSIRDVDASENRLVIDSSGNVLVGKNASSLTTVGIELKSDGNLIATRAGVVTSLNREDSDGTIIDLRKDGTTVGFIGSTSSVVSHIVLDPRGGAKGAGIMGASIDANTGIIQPTDKTGAEADNVINLGGSGARWKDFYLGGTAYLQEKITVASANLKIGVDGSATSSINISSASLYPQTDGSMNLGFSASSFRFATVFATTGTINTSDEKQKQDIEELNEAELRVAQKAKTLMRKYRMISSVEEKGDDARIHVGIIAQDLEKAFADEGLDAGRYGMFIKETTINDDGEEQTAYAIRYNELLAFIISSI